VVNYFVYYRVAPGGEPRAREQIRRLHAELAASMGARCRLMSKRGEPDLWMEIYEAVPDPAAFEHALEKAVRELQLEVWLAPGSRRHLECFEG
jgi:uncharacterized protein DUF4936